MIASISGIIKHKSEKTITVDVNGVESPDGDAPIREDWIYGAGNTKNLAS